jgi:hypothetical protein
MGQKQAPAKAKKPSTEIVLSVDARVTRNGYFLRRSVGEATVEDGRRVEVCLNADGAYLATIYETDRAAITYSISAAAMVEAVLAHADAREKGVSRG